MLSLIRKILIPVSLLYGLLMWLRNKAYDWGLFRSTEFDIPVIAVGNLSVGGTGKSPMIEYLAELLSQKYRVAVLSRGYGRSTRGFVQADQGSTAKDIGDEPLQIYRKFTDVSVAVCENRVDGIRALQHSEKVELVLLDDAFQHRRARAGLYILLTTYDNLYAEDFMLPTGYLREPSSGAKRADMIMVTKCPNDLGDEEKRAVAMKLDKGDAQELFFTGISYAEYVLGAKEKIALKDLSSKAVLLVTGIANTEPLEEFLHQNEIRFSHLKYRDHKSLNEAEMQAIRNSFSEMHVGDKIILTTEKDYVRNFLQTDLPVYYLPIRTVLLEREDEFQKSILDYVRQDQGDSEFS